MKGKKKGPVTKKVAATRSSRSERLQVDYNFENPHNDHLFRNQEAGALYNNIVAKKAISKCYYYAFPPNIPHLYDKVEEIERRWGFGNLACLNCPSYDVITRLFYANAIFHHAEEKVTSYILGENFEISVSNLCDLLGLKDDGEKVYNARKGRPDPAIIDHMKKVVTNNYASENSASHLAAPEKFVWAIGNNILTPVAKLKANLENRNIMLLYRMWYPDQLIMHVPNLILSHMESVMSQKNASLPYGTMISHMLELQGFTIPVQDWDC